MSEIETTTTTTSNEHIIFIIQHNKYPTYVPLCKWGTWIMNVFCPHHGLSFLSHLPIGIQFNWISLPDTYLHFALNPVERQQNTEYKRENERETGKKQVPSCCTPSSYENYELQIKCIYDIHKTNETWIATHSIEAHNRKQKWKRKKIRKMSQWFCILPVFKWNW